MNCRSLGIETHAYGMLAIERRLSVRGYLPDSGHIKRETLPENHYSFAATIFACHLVST